MQGRNPQYDTQPIISAFNLIATTYAGRRGIPVGQNKYFFPPESFNPPSQPIPLSSRIEAWKGFFVSVRPTVRNLMVNVNICTSAFYIPSERLSDIMERLGPSSAQFLRRVRVTTKHLGYPRKYSIKGFSRKNSREETFDCEECVGKVNIEQYFLKSMSSVHYDSI